MNGLPLPVLLTSSRDRGTPAGAERITALGRALCDATTERPAARPAPSSIWVTADGDVRLLGEPESPAPSQPELFSAVAALLYELALGRPYEETAPLVAVARPDLPARLSDAIDRALGRAATGPKFAHLADLRDALGEPSRLHVGQLRQLVAEAGVPLQPLPSLASNDDGAKEPAGGWEGPLSWPVWILGALAWLALIVWVKLRYDF